MPGPRGGRGGGGCFGEPRNRKAFYLAQALAETSVLFFLRSFGSTSSPGLRHLRSKGPVQFRWMRCQWSPGAEEDTVSSEVFREDIAGASHEKRKTRRAFCGETDLETGTRGCEPWLEATCHQEK